MAHNAVTCPSCGLEEPFQDGQSALQLHEIAEFTCDGCRTRVIYGRVMPRIVVEPYMDAQGFTWIRTRYQDPKTREDIYVVDLDPILAASHAKNELALVIP